MSAEPKKIDFNSQIRPILSDKCYACHGPDSENRQADLRLDLEEAAKDYAIVPGEVDESEVFSRIMSDDPDEVMPPAKFKVLLSEKEKALIGQWIKEGAVWDTHWSFGPIKKVDPPKVDNSDWSAHTIDRFVFNRLKNSGLSPQQQASKEKLIRRVTFDLTGLPPSLEEIDAFLADSSDNAYEKLIDRLLQSEKFGERMASDWLDVARYSDTYGYQVDRDRYVWPWRDWVIRAFNQNLPYDQFLTKQIAGDLLPNATDDDILATTFNRLHPQKVEGGSVAEEFRVEYVADRTQTFATAFLGLTMECCRCHDHKYDPITQKEYYQLYAYFNSVDESGLYSYFTSSVPTPTLRMMDDATKQKLATLEEKISAAEKKLADHLNQHASDFKTWNESQTEVQLPEPIAHLDFEDHKDGANKSVEGKVGKGVLLSGDDGIGLKVGNFRRYQPFSVSLWMNTPDVKDRAIVFHRSKAWTDAGSRGYQLMIEDGRLSASLIHFWPGNAIRVITEDLLPINQWKHVTVTYDGSSKAAGLKIYVDGQQAQTKVVKDHLIKNITGGGGDNITIGQRMRDRGFTNGQVDEFKVYDRQLTKLEVGLLHNGENQRKDNSADLKAHYLATANPEFATDLAALQTLREQRSKQTDGLQEIMVMRELPEPRDTNILVRGAYDAPSEAVQPMTLSAFPQMEQVAANRLGLSNWLTSGQHPLTARVAVNRYWQICFGNGLVRTPEDFGSQGKPPTHPQLLDWLAADFMQNGWDVKRLIKQMVMSNTYCQSSVASAKANQNDPENLLLSHAPAYRLSAEMLRDNALAVSGLLVNKIGGAPVRPYDLEVSFKPSKRDKGEGLYRRSVYTYWKRTGPAPAMMTLDASKRDVCRVQRERTSSPLQAFVLMNSPQFVESATVLSQRLIERHPEDIDAQLVDMFRLLTSRKPSDPELTLLRELFDSELAHFTDHPDEAKKYLENGDSRIDAKLNKIAVAALAVVTNTVMNFDECVTKR
ncbi:MAG: hypothetical protein COA78_21515 [Blastopirellula sp.]|nr:MAG: hypothetical protein COA78_21515 [Blastopirellula sp.]